MSGDRDGFAATFDQHRESVYRHALRVTATVQDAEDVTAAAFLELWRQRKSVRVVDGSVLPWLLVTTTNLACNLARVLRRYRALIVTLPRSKDARSAGDIALEQMEEARVSEVQVRQVLTSMTPSDAALIALTMFEHYSPAEVAEVLGISEGAARTRLHRARARMASVIQASPAGASLSRRDSSIAPLGPPLLVEPTLARVTGHVREGPLAAPITQRTREGSEGLVSTEAPFVSRPVVVLPSNVYDTRPDLADQRQSVDHDRNATRPREPIHPG